MNILFDKYFCTRIVVVLAPLREQEEQHMEALEKIRGTVTFFHHVRLYGYIQRADNGEEVYVHKRGLRKTGLVRLYKGQTVMFRLADNPKHPGQKHAVDITAAARPTPRA